jgi:hypothetical protein
MSHPAPIGLLCRFTPGGFSGQRVALIRLADGQTHKGLAPLQYCWTRDKKPLGPEEPAEGQAVDGIVAARYLRPEQDGKVVVSIPDGDVIVVPRSLVTARPTPEPASHVPV